MSNHLVLPPSGPQSQNLWQRALETLDDEVKARLDFTNTGKRNILAAVLQTAQEKKQLCMQKRWKFKRSNGEVIILRDVMEKIIVWLDKFKAVGDVAVQYDPAHTSLAWAGVRFVLQVAVSDKHVFGATVEGLETISHLITRYAIFENLYMQRDLTARGELEAMLAGLYAEVLIFLAKARQYFRTSTAIRVVKSTFRAEEDYQMQKIFAQETKVSSLAKLADAELQQDTGRSVAALRNLLEGLRHPINRLVDQATIFSRSLHEKKYLELIRWLSSVPFSRHQQGHSESRIPGSGQWLLDHPQYISWKSSSSSSILLLHGILGSGKTSLASAVVDSFLGERSGQASPAPLAYFYCAKNAFELERADPAEIIRSIVRQLTFTSAGQRRVHEALLTEYARREAEAKIDGFDVPRLRTAECIKVILDITGSNPAAIIVDAVDEIQETHRHELLEALIEVMKKSASVVKVFVTSRDNSNVHALLHNASTIRIQSHNNAADMELCVHHCVNLAIQKRRLLNGNVSDNLQKDLVKSLLDGAGEMFLWVVLQIDNLCRMKHEVDVRTAMRQLSKNTLNQLYADTFSQISEGETFACNTAMHAFSWLLCAREAFSPAAFLAAIAMTDPDHEIRLELSSLMDMCFNLIVLDSKLNILRFAHVSIQEFLEAQPSCAPQSAHRLAAMSCLDVCMQGPPAGIDVDLRPPKQFYRYGALYWAEHYRAAGVTNSDDKLLQKLRAFVFNNGETSLSFISWIDEVKEFVDVMANDHPLKKALGAVMNSSYTPLFTACVFGLMSLVDAIDCAIDIDWNQKNYLGHSALYLASAAGHESIARFLVRRGADVNATGGRHSNPLHAACFEGHIDVLQLLLDHGADPQLSGVFDSALHASFLGNHEEAALILLAKEFDILNQNDYDSILQQAAQAGFTEVIQILQKTYSSSFGTSNSAQRKAIEAAIIKGQLGVFERFLLKSSDAKHDLPSDAISTAALRGHNSMIIRLLDAGLDIEREGQFGTPLRAATLMGHESTVRILLDLGAEVNVCGSLGDALQASAMKGYVSITTLLLQKGAYVNRPDASGFYGNALQAAAYRGHQPVVEVLLSAGANVHQRGIAKDALHAAAEGGHEKIVRFFLEEGFDFAPPRSYGCAYMAAWKTEDDDLLPDESLLRKGLSAVLRKIRWLI